ncbi:MAG: hypothetical protein GQ534_04155 [Candidatus Delongbacteria bacterium]|nr:hypothetical protein [Candidatus Delongbacteria bacterium]
MINLSSNSKKLTLIMFFITLIGVTIAYKYYENINSLEDPRILHIKKMHLKYNLLITDNKTTEVLSMLDSMDVEYEKIPHYSNSFERGVIYTDKAAVYLSMALYQARDEAEKAKFLDIAEDHIKTSLTYYENWEKEYSVFDEVQLKERVSSDFSDINLDNQENIIEKRISLIQFALQEMSRRYSVTYTNLGIVMRHKLLQDSSIVYYKKALDLWEDNHTAKSNLNVLMGEKPIKRGFIEKMFPPERKED